MKLIKSFQHTLKDKHIFNVPLKQGHKIGHLILSISKLHFKINILIILNAHNNTKASETVIMTHADVSLALHENSYHCAWPNPVTKHTGKLISRCVINIQGE